MSSEETRGSNQQVQAPLDNTPDLRKWNGRCRAIEASECRPLPSFTGYHFLIKIPMEEVPRDEEDRHHNLRPLSHMRGREVSAGHA
jgi:hypothetical protein